MAVCPSNCHGCDHFQPNKEWACSFHGYCVSMSRMDSHPLWIDWKPPIERRKMAKAYLVTSACRGWEYIETSVCGVFSSYEKARNYVDGHDITVYHHKLTKQNGDWYKNIDEWSEYDDSTEDDDFMWDGYAPFETRQVYPVTNDDEHFFYVLPDGREIDDWSYVNRYHIKEYEVDACE